MSFLKSRIITYLFYVFVVFLLPILFLFFFPFIIWRQLVSTLAKVFGGVNLGKILTTSSTSHATSLKTGTCVLPLIVEGQLNLEHIKDYFTKTVLNTKDPKDGSRLFYQELRQTVVSWGGYFFWKDIPNFKLPIRLLDVDPVDLTSQRGLELLVSFYNRQWKLGVEPLWELLVITGLKGVFAIVLVTHHTLGDSVSCQTLVDKFSYPSIIPKKSSASRSTTNPLVMIRTLLRIPYDAARYVQLLMHQKSVTTADSSCNGKKHKKEMIPNSQLTQASTSFHLPDLKKIAANQSVSLNTVLMSAVQGSLQRVWSNANILYFPTPVPNHTEKLRNVGGTGYVELLNNGEGSQDRLQHIQKQIQNLKFSTFPLFSSIMGTLFGSLPPCLLRRTINSAGGSLTFVLSTFIVSRHPFSIFGYPVMRLGAMGCSHVGTGVVAFFAFTIGNRMSFVVLADEGVVNEEKGKALAKGVVEEFETMKELNSVDHISITMQEP